MDAALSNAGSSRISPFGRQLLQADEAEFKRLLRISTDTFVDEGGNSWRNYAAALSADQVKFGTQSLLTTSGTIQSAHPLTFGDDPFTVSCWAYLGTASDTGWIFRAYGTQASFGFYRGKTNNVTDWWIKPYGGTTALAALGSTYKSITRNKWYHFELTYNGNGSVKFFLNGALMYTWSKTINREARRIIWGYQAGYIDECRILDGICEHTAAFTRPSDKYSFDDYPDNTLVLLHFE